MEEDKKKTKKEVYMNDMETYLPLDSLQTMDIKLKATPLKPTSKDALKVMFGFKFSPKVHLNLEAKKAVEDMIKNGEHLRNYRDYVSGKIASSYTASKYVEMSGYISGIFLGFSGEDSQEKHFKSVAESLYKGFKEGWDNGKKLKDNITT